MIGAISINNRAVFSENSFCKPCSQSLQGGGGREERKEGRKRWEKNERKGKQRKEGERKKERGKLETFHHACFSPFTVPLAKMNSFSLLDHLEKDIDRYRYGCGYGYRYRHSMLLLLSGFSRVQLWATP